MRKNSNDCTPYKRDVKPSLAGVPEIGWVLASAFHGKGYATEAALAVIEWGDVNFGPVQTGCLIHPDNQASRRVAEKCGYREFQLTEYKGQPSLIFYR